MLEPCDDAVVSQEVTRIVTLCDDSATAWEFASMMAMNHKDNRAEEKSLRERQRVHGPPAGISAFGARGAVPAACHRIEEYIKKETNMHLFGRPDLEKDAAEELCRTMGDRSIALTR